MAEAYKGALALGRDSAGLGAGALKGRARTRWSRRSPSSRDPEQSRSSGLHPRPSPMSASALAALRQPAAFRSSRAPRFPRRLAVEVFVEWNRGDAVLAPRALAPLGSRGHRRQAHALTHSQSLQPSRHFQGCGALLEGAGGWRRPGQSLSGSRRLSVGQERPGLNTNNSSGKKATPS